MAETPKRRPYTGSCPCGATKFLVFLTMPHPRPAETVAAQYQESQRIYKCNCTLCHKAGIFHVRVASATDDFLLLSPSDSNPTEGNDSLGVYRRNGTGEIGFTFCRTCGGRCFSVRGPMESADLDISSLGVSDDALERLGVEKGAVTKVWRAERGKFLERPRGTCYLSINASTIDAGQEGFDLVEWGEKKWVYYLDALNLAEQGGYERPCRGGAW